MALSKSLALAVAVSVLASGCVFLDRGSKWPSLQMPEQKPAPAPASAPTPSPPPPTAGTSAEEVSKTLDSLGARLDLRATDLASTEAMIEDQRTRYKTALDAAKSGAPGGPADPWNVAEIELTRLASDVARFGDLDEALAGDSARLAEAYAAAREVEKNAGADQPLTARTGEMIARAGTLLDAARTRRAEEDRYVEGERRTLAELRPKAPVPAEPALPADREAYVVFHLDRDDTGYEAALRSAIMKALDRKPGMTFDLYTVAGSADDDVKAQNRAEDVERILKSLNVADDHMTLTAIRRSEATPPEVRLYIR
jgi:hypothetical protein